MTKPPTTNTIPTNVHIDWPLMALPATVPVPWPIHTTPTTSRAAATTRRDVRIAIPRDRLRPHLGRPVGLVHEDTVSDANDCLWTRSFRSADSLRRPPAPPVREPVTNAHQGIHSTRESISVTTAGPATKHARTVAFPAALTAARTPVNERWAHDCHGERPRCARSFRASDPSISARLQESIRSPTQSPLRACPP